MSGFNQTSLFDDILKKAKDSKSKNKETEIEDKMKERNQNMFGTKVNTNLQDITEDVETKEISLRKNNRDDEYEKRRKFGKINNKAITNSLKDRIKVSSEAFERASEIKVNHSQFGEFLQYFRDTSDINKYYYGLVGIRKLSSLSN